MRKRETIFSYENLVGVHQTWGGDTLPSCVKHRHTYFPYSSLGIDTYRNVIYYIVEDPCVNIRLSGVVETTQIPISVDHFVKLYETGRDS